MRGSAQFRTVLVLSSAPFFAPISLALAERQRSKILAFNSTRSNGPQKDFGEPPPAVELIEGRHAIGPRDCRLAVDRERCPANPSCRCCDARKPLGPIIAAAREQPHVIAADDQPISIVPDFVDPLGAGWRLVGEDGNARLNEAGGKPAMLRHQL
jgi:hypothetical protein